MSEGISRRAMLGIGAASSLAALVESCTPIRVLNGLAEGCFKNDDYVHTIHHLDDILKREPNNVKALSMRGYSYAGLFQYDHAIKDFDQAITLEPTWAKLYVFRGTAFYSQARIRKSDILLERARDDLKKAIELDPGNPDAHAVLGYVYALFEQEEECYKALKEALRLIDVEKKPTKHIPVDKLRQDYQPLQQKYEPAQKRDSGALPQPNADYRQRGSANFATLVGWSCGTQEHASKCMRPQGSPSQTLRRPVLEFAWV